MIRFVNCWLLLYFTVTVATRLAWADSATPSSAEPPTAVCSGQLRPQDSLWLIGTRHLGYSNPVLSDVESFHILRYDASGWQERNAADFRNDRRNLTVFYVHGNRVDGGGVFQRGREAYDALVARSGQPNSVRFVIWSWPSTQICGPRRDVQSKAARTDVESCYLAMMLAQLPPETNVGLLGFSFGARIISGALHLLSGSELCGYRLSGQPRPMLRPRAVLMAAAMDRDWWLPGGCHDQCPAVAGALLVQFNPCDPVLRLYPRIDRPERPQALGYTGFPWPAAFDAGTLEQQNVSGQLGKTHDVSKYLESPAVMHRARQTLSAGLVP